MSYNLNFPDTQGNPTRKKKEKLKDVLYFALKLTQNDARGVVQKFLSMKEKKKEGRKKIDL